MTPPPNLGPVRPDEAHSLEPSGGELALTKALGFHSANHPLNGSQCPERYNASSQTLHVLPGSDADTVWLIAQTRQKMAVWRFGSRIANTACSNQE